MARVGPERIPVRRASETDVMDVWRIRLRRASRALQRVRSTGEIGVAGTSRLTSV